MANPLKDDLEHILAHTLPFWEELRGNRLFITGGTGFFGCWLLESFAWASERLHLNAQAIVLTRRPDVFARKVPHLASNPAIRLYRGDVRTFAFPEGSFSHVIHAATETSSDLNKDDPLQMLDTIISGTRRTLEMAVQCGARKLLLTSSGAVYGRQPPTVTHVSEEYEGGPDTMNPLSAYAEGKRIAELLCSIYARRTGLETKIARCFAFVGPYLPLDADFAIGNFIKDVLEERPIAVRGCGTALRSYLYAADLAIWLWTILFRGKSCHPYNVGSEKELTIAELAEGIAGLKLPPFEVQIKGPACEAKQTQRYVPCTARARKELGLAPERDLQDSILRTMVASGTNKLEIPQLLIPRADLRYASGSDKDND